MMDDPILKAMQGLTPTQIKLLRMGWKIRNDYDPDSSYGKGLDGLRGRGLVEYRRRVVDYQHGSYIVTLLGHAVLALIDKGEQS